MLKNDDGLREIPRSGFGKMLRDDGKCIGRVMVLLKSKENFIKTLTSNIGTYILSNRGRVPDCLFYGWFGAFFFIRGPVLCGRPANIGKKLLTKQVFSDKIGFVLDGHARVAQRWSTTLPRWGSRVRSPSRAREAGSFGSGFFAVKTRKLRRLSRNHGGG